jgi:hypothetical protein
MRHILGDLNEECPEFLETVLSRCVEVGDLKNDADIAQEQLFGDLAEDRLSRRRELGFLAAEDAAYLLRDLRLDEDISVLIMRLSRFRKTKCPQVAPISWATSTALPALRQSSSFQLKTADICERYPKLEKVFQEDFALIANILVQAAHLGSKRLKEFYAPLVVRAYCEVGSNFVESGDGAFVFSCFRAGWRRVLSELAIPAARELDRILADRNPDFKLLRKCWIDVIMARGGTAPSFARLILQGDFGTSSKLLDEVSAVLSGRVTLALRYLVSEIPALPGFLTSNESDEPIFPSEERDFEIGTEFIKHLRLNV